MSKLGMKELILGAALALPGASAEARPNKAAEAVLRAHCVQIAEAVKVEMRELLSQLEFRTGSMAFAPGNAAEKSEKECLKKMGVEEPKASDIKE